MRDMTFAERSAYFKKKGTELAEMLGIRGMWGGGDGLLSEAFYELVKVLDALDGMAPFREGDRVRLRSLPSDMGRYACCSFVKFGALCTVKTVDVRDHGFIVDLVFDDEPEPKHLFAFRAMHVELQRLPGKLTDEQRQLLSCKVCFSIPDEDGDREHGKGCFVLSADGGGTDHLDVRDIR